MPPRPSVVASLWVPRPCSPCCACVRRGLPMGLPCACLLAYALPPCHVLAGPGHRARGAHGWGRVGVLSLFPVPSCRRPASPPPPPLGVQGCPAAGALRGCAGPVSEARRGAARRGRRRARGRSRRRGSRRPTTTGRRGPAGVGARCGRRCGGGGGGGRIGAEVVGVGWGLGSVAGAGLRLRLRLQGRGLRLQGQGLRRRAERGMVSWCRGAVWGRARCGGAAVRQRVTAGAAGAARQRGLRGVSRAHAGAGGRRGGQVFFLLRTGHYEDAADLADRWSLRPRIKVPHALAPARAHARTHTTYTRTRAPAGPAPMCFDRRLTPRRAAAGAAGVGAVGGAAPAGRGRGGAAAGAGAAAGVHRDGRARPRTARRARC